MTDLEIAINMLAEATTTQISRNENPKGMVESAGIASRGGAVANDARKAVERETGQSVVSPLNAKQIAQGEGELVLKDRKECNYSANNKTIKRWRGVSPSFNTANAN